jgi:hypothetical protein
MMAEIRRLARRNYPVRQKCRVKGCNKLAERHHEDWRKPLDIVWLCRKHHLQWHNSAQTLGEIKEYGEFTLEEFLEGKSKEEWLKERLKQRRRQLEEETQKFLESLPKEKSLELERQMELDIPQFMRDREQRIMKAKRSGKVSNH